MSDYNHVFSGRVLRSVESYPWPAPNDETLDDYWRRLGFTRLNYRDDIWSEGSPFDIGMWQHPEYGCLVEIWTSDQGLMDVHCPTLIDLIEFLRDYVRPLSELNHHFAVRRLIGDIQHYLFDQQDGLLAVQRVAIREKRLFRQRKEDQIMRENFDNLTKKQKKPAGL